MMYSIVLSFKRAMRAVYVPVLLAVLALSLFLAPMLGHEEALPLAAVCDFDNSELSGRVCAYLLENGFEMCSEEDEMRLLIANGEYNCGVVIPRGFGEKLTLADTEDLVVFIESALSFTPELYRNHVGTAIFCEAAPYISWQILADMGISVQRMVEEYNGMMALGTNVEFVTENVDAEIVKDNGRANAYIYGIAALLIFAFMMYAACDTLNGGTTILLRRVGARKTLLHTVLPDMLVRTVSVWAAVTISAVASKLITDDSLLIAALPEIMVYTLLLADLGILLVGIAAHAGVIQVSAFFMLVVSAFLCPIYIDMALFSRWIGIFRYILPPYWLWVCGENMLMSVVAAAIVPLSAMVYIVGAKNRECK